MKMVHGVRGDAYWLLRIESSKDLQRDTIFIFCNLLLYSKERISKIVASDGCAYAWS